MTAVPFSECKSTARIFNGQALTPLFLKKLSERAENGDLGRALRGADGKNEGQKRRKRGRAAGRGGGKRRGEVEDFAGGRGRGESLVEGKTLLIYLAAATVLLGGSPFYVCPAAVSYGPHSYI